MLGETKSKIVEQERLRCPARLSAVVEASKAETDEPDARGRACQLFRLCAIFHVIDTDLRVHAPIKMRSRARSNAIRLPFRREGSLPREISTRCPVPTPRLFLPLLHLLHTRSTYSTPQQHGSSTCCPFQSYGGCRRSCMSLTPSQPTPSTCLPPPSSPHVLTSHFSHRRLHSEE